MKSNSLFGMQVHVYLPLYWFCLIGETWDQIIYPWCDATCIKKCLSTILKCKYMIATRDCSCYGYQGICCQKQLNHLNRGQIRKLKLPLSREALMILEATHLNLHQKKKICRGMAERLSMAQVRLWSKCCLQPDVAGTEEVLYIWVPFCRVQWNNELYFKHEHIQCILNCISNRNRSFTFPHVWIVY